MIVHHYITQPPGALLVRSANENRLARRDATIMTPFYNQLLCLENRRNRRKTHPGQAAVDRQWEKPPNRGPGRPNRPRGSGSTPPQVCCTLGLISLVGVSPQTLKLLRATRARSRQRLASSGGHACKFREGRNGENLSGATPFVDDEERCPAHGLPAPPSSVSCNFATPCPHAMAKANSRPLL